MSFSDNNNDARQALQVRHLSGSHGMAAVLMVSAQEATTDEDNGWGVARSLDNAFAGVVGRLDVFSQATSSLQSQVDAIEDKTGLDPAGTLTWTATNNYIATANSANLRLGIERLDDYLGSAEERLGLVDDSGSYAAPSYSSVDTVDQGSSVIAAVGALDAGLETEKERIDAILAGANVDADTFLEVYNAYSAISGAADASYALRLNDAFGDVINGEGNWDVSGINGDYVGSSTDLTDALQDLDTRLGGVDDVLGIAHSAADMGEFTHGIVSDNVSVKTALQSLETAVNSNDEDISGLIGLTGRPSGSTGLGVFDGDIITDGVTIRTAFEEVETELGNVRGDLQTAIGIADEDRDLGDFDGDTITSAGTVKEALQELETALESQTSNLDNDFQAKHLSGDAGAVGSVYALRFSADEPQIRMVVRADSEVDVYFEIR